jgi:hypothetical protein
MAMLEEVYRVPLPRAKGNGAPERRSRKDRIGPIPDCLFQTRRGVDLGVIMRLDQ